MVKGLMVFLGLSLIANSALASPMDLKTAMGSVVIVAPTALNGPTNQGIWFVNPQSKEFSLTLPALDATQVYASWIFDNCTGKAVSAGAFRAVGGIDSDSAGAFAGPKILDFPPVPGSDFVTLGSDLADGAHDVLVTIESYPMNVVSPSHEVVLRVSIPKGTAVGTALTLQNVAK